MTQQPAADALAEKRREYEALLAELDATTRRIREIGDTFQRWADKRDRLPTERQRRRFEARIAARAAALEDEYERLKARGRELSARVMELARKLEREGVT